MVYRGVPRGRTKPAAKDRFGLKPGDCDPEEYRGAGKLHAGDLPSRFWGERGEAWKRGIAGRKADASEAVPATAAAPRFWLEKDPPHLEDGRGKGT